MQNNQDKNAFSDNFKNQSQDINKRYQYAVKNFMNSENDRQGISYKSQKQSHHTHDQSNRSRSKILDGQKFTDLQQEEEEFNPKFALLEAEIASSNNQSILKTRNVSKKKSLDSWDQEDPGFTDVRSFGNTLSAFKSKQFYQNNRPFPYRNQSNFQQKIGNRSNFHHNGSVNSSNQSSTLRNSKEALGGLIISSQKFSPKQMENSQKIQIENKNTDGVNTQNFGERNIEEGNTSEEEEKNSQMFRVTEEQFLKWENKETIKDIHQNQLMKKYGDQQTPQANQNSFYNFHLSNSPNSQQPLAEMKIYGNSFNALRKDQDQTQQDGNTQQQQQQIQQQKLKKIDLNTNLKFPNQNNQQILFPSSFNINLHIQNNQQVLQQFKSQQRLKSFQQYKYHTNYFKDPNLQQEDNKPIELVNNQNFSIQNIQITQDNSNIKNLTEPKENMADLDYEQNEEHSSSFINKPGQIINTLSSRVAPIHSKKIFNQDELESEVDIIVNSKILDFNFNPQLKSKSLSPLRFPKHRAIPPIRLRQKKKEREEGQFDQDFNKNIQNIAEIEQQNQQNNILLIKNISLIQKNISNQKLQNIHSTNIHSPANIQQVDQLLNIISPSLYPQQQYQKQQSLSQVQILNQNQLQNSSLQQITDQQPKQILTKQQENDNFNRSSRLDNTQIQNKNDITVNQVSVNNSNDKMKIFQLKFNGNQFGKNSSSQENIAAPPQYIQKYLKKKQSPSPRQQSPWLNLQNQVQNNIPSLIINQIQSQDQQTFLQKKISQNFLIRKDSSQLYHLDNNQKSKNVIDIKNFNQISTGSPKNGQILNQYQQHIDFMDYIQGKSANIGQKQINFANIEKQEEFKKQIITKNEQNNSQYLNYQPDNNNNNSNINDQDKKQRLEPIRKVKTAFVPNQQNQQSKQQNLNQSFQGKINKSNQKFHKFGQLKKIKNAKNNDEVKQDLQNGKNQDHNQLLVMNSFKQKQNIQQKQEELQQVS